MPTYRAAIIGAGGIARNRRIPACINSARTELAAVADVKQEALERCATLFGSAARYGDHAELLRREKPDIVVICTRVDSHCPLVLDCAQAGVKGILCEKPMARDLAEAQRMIDECERRGAKLAIGHQRRHSAQHQFTKQLIERGELGRLIALWGSCPPHLTEWGTHYADLMLWYAGEADFVMGQVSGETHPGRGGVPEPDPVIGYLRFKNGAIGVLETNLMGRHDNDRPRIIHIRGDRGEAEVMIDGGMKYCTWDTVSWVSPNLAPREAFQLQLEDLCDCVEKDKTPLDSGRDGMKALEILMAIVESSRIQGRVALPMANS